MLVPFDEKLKEIALKIKDIAYKLGLIADYIVETDTTTTTNGSMVTTWYYEKKNNGFARLVGYRMSSLVTGNFKAWGSLYYAEFSGAYFPFELTDVWKVNMFVSDTAGTILMNGTGGTAGGGNDSTTTFTGNFTAIRPSAYNIPSVKVCYEVEGKWK